MKPGIHFDPATHTYRVGGEIVPSVTQILRDAGMVPDPRHYTEGAAARGTAVHKAVELLVQAFRAKRTPEEIDRWMDGLHPVIRPYVEAYGRFRAESGFKPLRSEVRVYNREWGYCGTVDLIGKFPKGRTVVIEIKSGGPHPSHVIQLAAYQECQPAATRGFLLYLRKDGTYRLDEPGLGTNHWHLFCAAVRVAAFRRAHGLLETKGDGHDDGND